MKRKWLALALCLCLLLCACGREEEEQASRYLGYTLSGEEKGGSALAEANAYRLRAEEGGETTVLTLKFKSGSRMSGTETEADALSAPPYTLWMEQNPARLMLRLEGLSYWDYERDLPAGTGMVLGSFRYALEGDAAGEGFTYICFQLATDCAFKAQESGGSLSVTLLPKGSGKKEDKPAANGGEEQPWYVVGDSFRECCTGRLMGREAFTPTLDQSLSHILLISAPYPTEIEAELARTKLLEQNPEAVAAEWSVVQLPEGGRPAYDENARYAAAYEESVQRRDGEVRGAEVFLTDGLYLSTLPRRMGGGVLYSRRMTRGSGVDSFSFEQLYTRDSQGADKPLLSYEFATVEQALFSPDGRKLAVLERSAERTNLYIVDVEMREVTAELTQAGFGELVSAFCWDSMGSVLFAVSGSGEMQIHAYDFSVPDETRRHTVVEKNGANEGHIGYCGGEVYFIESDMDKDTIYRIKPEGGVRKSFHSGSAFALSPNNAYMAISASPGVSASAGADSFQLLDMQSGKAETVATGFAVYDFLWSLDGSRIYYFENRLSGGLGEEAGEDAAGTALETPQDDYPFTLWVYELASGQSRAVCDLPGASISASSDPERLYFSYFDPETVGEKIRATYWIEAGPERDAAPEAEPEGGLQP